VIRLPSDAASHASGRESLTSALWLGLSEEALLPNIPYTWLQAVRCYNRFMNQFSTTLTKFLPYTRIALKCIVMGETLT